MDRGWMNRARIMPMKSEVSGSVCTRANDLRPWEPLDPAVQAGATLSLGHDFSAIRIHADPHVQGDEGISPDKGLAVKTIAGHGVLGSGTPLPHLDRIQASFGRHDIRNIVAHVGGEAARATNWLNASAYTMGDHVAFGHAPSLRTAAHEAAHAIQQRNGIHLPRGYGLPGDEHERHAHAVADRVARGESVEGLLDERSRSNGRGEISGVIQFDSEEDPANLPFGGMFPFAVPKIDSAQVQRFRALVAERAPDLFDRISKIEPVREYLQKVDDHIEKKTATSQTAALNHSKEQEKKKNEPYEIFYGMVHNDSVAANKVVAEYNSFHDQDWAFHILVERFESTVGKTKSRARIQAIIDQLLLAKPDLKMSLEENLLKGTTGKVLADAEGSYSLALDAYSDGALADAMATWAMSNAKRGTSGSLNKAARELLRDGAVKEAAEKGNLFVAAKASVDREFARLVAQAGVYGWVVGSSFVDMAKRFDKSVVRAEVRSAVINDLKETISPSAPQVSWHEKEIVKLLAKRPSAEITRKINNLKVGLARYATPDRFDFLHTPGVAEKVKTVLASHEKMRNDAFSPSKAMSMAVPVDKLDYSTGQPVQELLTNDDKWEIYLDYLENVKNGYGAWKQHSPELLGYAPRQYYSQAMLDAHRYGVPTTMLGTYAGHGRGQYDLHGPKNGVITAQWPRSINVFTGIDTEEDFVHEKSEVLDCSNVYNGEHYEGGRAIRATSSDMDAFNKLTQGIFGRKRSIVQINNFLADRTGKVTPPPLDLDWGRINAALEYDDDSIYGSHLSETMKNELMTINSLIGKRRSPSPSDATKAAVQNAGADAIHDPKVAAKVFGIMQRLHRELGVESGRAGLGVSVKHHYHHPQDPQRKVWVVVWYLHLSRIATSAGQWLLLGAPLGTIGKTGNAISEHVHMSIDVFLRNPSQGSWGRGFYHLSPEGFFSSEFKLAACTH